MTMAEFYKSWEDDERYDITRFMVKVRVKQLMSNILEEKALREKIFASQNDMVKVTLRRLVSSPFKIIEVGDCMVFENSAPTLETMFAKYGDFTCKSTQKNRKLKMFCMIVVCDAVHNMCNTEVVDITEKLLCRWFYYLSWGHDAGFEIQFAFDQWSRMLRAHLGLQDITERLGMKPTAFMTFQEFFYSFEDDERSELIRFVGIAFEQLKNDPQIYILGKEAHSMIFTSENIDGTFPSIVSSVLKIIKVDDYMVFENSAPTLKAMFAKHGDFGGKLRQMSRKLKILFMILVCDAVHNMSNTEAVDITVKLLYRWFCYLSYGHAAGFEIQFALDQWIRIIRAHLGLQDATFSDITITKPDQAKQRVEPTAPMTMKELMSDPPIQDATFPDTTITEPDEAERLVVVTITEPDEAERLVVREKEMEPWIVHFKHEHQLWLTSGKDALLPHCAMCTESFSGEHYCCPRSCFSLHISCSKIPECIQDHPFHPQHTLSITKKVMSKEDFCDACGGSCDKHFAYKCSSCSFFLHIKCSLLTLITKINSEGDEDHHLKIHEQRPNQPQPMFLCERNKNYSYFCSCCHLPFDDDGGSLAYVCLQCKALLHKSCADIPWNIDHPFHPSHPLTLLPQAPTDRRRDLFETGFGYHCSKCRFTLDIHSASLKPTKINGQHLQWQQFRHHSHPLVLCNTGHNFCLPCMACGHPVEDSVYFCHECKYLVHKSCAELPQEINHVLHPMHTLTLHTRSKNQDYWICNGCSSNLDNFFFFKCCNNCSFWLDIKCALSKPATIKLEIHEHPLAFFNDGNACRACKNCRQTCHTPFFGCPTCYFFLHVHCISTIPKTIKSGHHRHLLTFTRSPVIRPYEEGRTEFYCDHCEQLREVEQPSYYCQKCHSFVAHPQCLVSQIVHVLDEEQSKKNSHARADKVEEPTALVTLNDFLCSFKGDEWDEIKRLVKVDIDVRFTQLLSGIRISMLEKEAMLNVFASKNYDGLLSSFISLESKIVEVGDYLAYENSASILEALFVKHGDFSGKSRQMSRKPKIFCMIVLCDAVYSMCNTEVVNVTTKLLRWWCFCLCWGHDAGFEIQFALDKFLRMLRAHLRLQDDTVTDITITKPDQAKQLGVVNSKL